MRGSNSKLTVGLGGWALGCVLLTCMVLHGLAGAGLANGWTEQAKLTASDGAWGDWFGRRVGIDGDTAIVGAMLDDVGGTDNGSVYIYSRSASTWTPQAKLTPSDPADSHRFGGAVAVSGNTAVVGAYRDGGGGVDAGAAYIFQRSGSTWTQQAKLTASDATAGDLFGFSASIHGETVIVGSRLCDHDVVADCGAAYIFQRSGSTWTQQAKLVASDAAADDQFGRFVSISGDTVIAAATHDGDGGYLSGAAYIFQRSGSAWTQQAKLAASDAAAEDEFGFGASIDGDRVVVGALHNDDAGFNSGCAYVFDRTGSTWTETTKLTAADAAAEDNFGLSVDIDGDAIVVGSRWDDPGGSKSGSAYIYKYISGVWAQTSKLTASDAAAGDELGWSVGIDGGTAIAGAHLDDYDSVIHVGSAYIFVPEPATLTLMGLGALGQLSRRRRNAS